MNTKPIETFLGGIPELFYDGVAYALPGLYLILGMAFNFDKFSNFKVDEIEFLENFLIDLLLVIVCLGILYLVGQILTTFSSYLVWKMPSWIISKLYRKKRKSKNIDWYKGYRFLEVKNPHVAILVTKRYARWIASRNIVLASFILLVISIFMNDSYIFVYLGILFVFSIDAGLRKTWLDNYINELVNIINTEKKEA